MIRCSECRARRNRKLIEEMQGSGYQWWWTDTGDIRERWWFFNKHRIQKKQVKITMPPEMPPGVVYRWKTISVVKNKLIMKAEAA